jgi:hypothetical protein
MENTRTYETIRLVRGKRKGEELLKFSIAHQDFDFRRLFIAECEQDLHVFCSRKLVSNWLAWGFLMLSLLIAPYVFIGLSCVMKIYSIYCLNKFKKVFRGYKLSLGFVDAVIQNDYGITLPK